MYALLLLPGVRVKWQRNIWIVSGGQEHKKADESFFQIGRTPIDGRVRRTGTNAKVEYDKGETKRIMMMMMPGSIAEWENKGVTKRMTTKM